LCIVLACEKSWRALCELSLAFSCQYSLLSGLNSPASGDGDSYSPERSIARVAGSGVAATGSGDAPDGPAWPASWGSAVWLGGSSAGSAGGGSAGGGFATVLARVNFSFGTALRSIPSMLRPTRRKAATILSGVVHLVHASAKICVNMPLLSSTPVFSSHHRLTTPLKVSCQLLKIWSSA
jgi:hypothetical protein